MSKIIGGEPLRLAVAFHELRNAIGRLRFGNRPVLLFTPRSVECGAYRLDGLDQFNWGFGFDANVEGIISVIDELAMNRMTVDFSEEGERQMVEIDVVGPDWINQDR
jgi:hypothetical protein